MLKGIPRSQSAAMPPTAANATPAKTWAASRTRTGTPPREEITMFSTSAGLVSTGTDGPAMTPLKEQVIELIRALPDETTIDDMMAELYFKAQVDSRLRELDEG